MPKSQETSESIEGQGETPEDVETRASVSPSCRGDEFTSCRDMLETRFVVHLDGPFAFLRMVDIDTLEPAVATLGVDDIDRLIETLRETQGALAEAGPGVKGHRFQSDDGEALALALLKALGDG